jgi:hypothetical protein
MRRFILGFAAVLLACPLPAGAAEGDLTRRDGFLLIWQGIQRPAFDVREAPFEDVQKGARGFMEITYAKARGLLDDDARFRPEDPLTAEDALVWLFRTRNVDVDGLLTKDAPSLVSGIAQEFGLADTLVTRGEAAATVVDRALTEAGLLDLMRRVDQFLARQEHEISLYSEKFHGKGTAFGETFDMWAMTAAHRTLPHNTLIKVTNVENGKSVTVRINDRGPYVNGRDLDLSLGAFTSIAPRSKGKIQATIQRLGDASLVGPCSIDAVQTRVGPDLRLTEGVPHTMRLGHALVLAAEKPFVVLKTSYPDGESSFVQDWVLPGQVFRLKPSLEGKYTVTVGSVDGRRREMEMMVSSCGETGA